MVSSFESVGELRTEAARVSALNRLEKAQQDCGVANLAEDMATSTCRRTVARWPAGVGGW